MPEFPITGILGRRGDGKTLFMTALAKMDADSGRKVFANYHLKGMDYEYISLKQVAQLPSWLHDATVCIDEIQEGADAREIFKKGNKGITKLATQLRKRQITFYYTTQVFTMVDKRMREQTDYLIQVQKIQPENPTHFRVQIYDREIPYETEMINDLIFYGVPIFDYYDTREVVNFDPEAEEEQDEEAD